MFKKRKGRKKDKKVKRECLDETQTLFYEQQIVDENRKLAQLRTTNQKLENEVGVLKKQLATLEEDRADIIEYLKRNIEEKINETRILNERIEALEQLRKDQLAAFSKKESAMEREYRTMETTLNAEIKLADGKLTALEDWRIARIDLMQKFEIQEQQLKEQEERHKEALRQADKALIIGKAKMQQEMEERLHKLAESFREATNIRIADATHTAIKENVSLNRELDAIIDICRTLYIDTANYKDMTKTLQFQADLFEEQVDITLKETLQQKNMIIQLTDDCHNMRQEYDRLLRLHALLIDYAKNLEEYEAKCIKAEKNVRILEQHLQEAKKSKADIMAEINAKCKEFNNLNLMLMEAKQCIIEALRLQENVSSEVCTSCHVDHKENMLRSLLNILQKQIIPNIPFPMPCVTGVKVDPIECQYRKGSLGLLFCNEAEKPEISEEAKNQLNPKKVSLKMPSCLSSRDSSDIISPQETVSTVSTKE